MKFLPALRVCYSVIIMTKEKVKDQWQKEVSEVGLCWQVERPGWVLVDQIPPSKCVSRVVSLAVCPGMCLSSSFPVAVSHGPALVGPIFAWQNSIRGGLTVRSLGSGERLHDSKSALPLDRLKEMSHPFCAFVSPSVNGNYQAPSSGLLSRSSFYLVNCLLHEGRDFRMYCSNNTWNRVNP